MDLMLEEMESHHLTEWMAFVRIEDEEHKRDMLARQAEAGVKNHKRRGR